MLGQRDGIRDRGGVNQNRDCLVHGGYRGKSGKERKEKRVGKSLETSETRELS